MHNGVYTPGLVHDMSSIAEKVFTAFKKNQCESVKEIIVLDF